MAGNHVLLETISLTQAASSVTFDNIPQTGYNDLKVVVSARSNRASNADSVIYKFNSSTSGYSYRQLYGGAGSGSSVTGSASGSPAYQFLGVIPATNNTTVTFGNQELYIPNYTASVNKHTNSDSVSENNATTYWQADLVAGLWSNTAAVTSIQFLTENAANFAVGSTFSLYGVADVNTTPAIAPKATGGNIVANDGTYWYHAFITSGNFVPQTSLTCDTLVVAGGGAGGEGQRGGGGGAGGLVGYSSQTLTATNYTVTVGAGGATGTYTTDAYAIRTATSGNNSQFGALTAAVGGGAGAAGDTTNSGATGGSGGGAWGGPGSGGAGTSGQGYAGGTAGGSGQYGAGGGGGAGGAGGNGNTTVGGNGGVGTTAYSSWGLATTTGENVSGTVYYAGGGSGDTYGGYGRYPGTRGYGGGGTGNNTSPVNQTGTTGTPNTGGGGGSGGNGGSGIVIIRYAMV